MVGIYFKTTELPVRYLIYIAITALSRVLIEIVGEEHRDRDRTTDSGRSDSCSVVCRVSVAVRPRRSTAFGGPCHGPHLKEVDAALCHQRT
jgi:hypothetical protein